MNPFEPPADQRSRRFPTRLGWRAVGNVLFGLGLVNVVVGLAQAHVQGWGWILFAALCFGLSYLALRKRRPRRHETS